MRIVVLGGGTAGYIAAAHLTRYLPQAVLEAYQEIATEPGRMGEGDVLVFVIRKKA